MVFATMSVAETSSNPLLSVLSGKKVRQTPIWLMRQAGRYLPEYQELRAKSANFLEFCYSPRLAMEATLQPVRRFGFDAAILFSDILVMPDALGQRVVFSDNGPKLKPIGSPSDLSRLDPKPAIGRLEPIFETIESVRANLGREVAVIGFCGAPWTVASYMVAGGGSADQGPSRLFAYRHRAAFQELIDLLVEASADYLVRQLLAGANAVQIFDSWAGGLPIAEFERWCVAPLDAIVTKVRVYQRRQSSHSRAALGHSWESLQESRVWPRWDLIQQIPRNLQTLFYHRAWPSKGTSTRSPLLPEGLN
jgi:uroporphyrinogen decarboxylase